MDDSLLGAALEDWSALRTFLVAAEMRSFTAAARHLGVSQSTVSRHVATLEEVVGQPLFVRAGRTVTLTDAGSALGPAAAHVHEAVAQFERVAVAKARTASGIVRLATVDELARRVLAPAFAKLRAQHPDLSLEVVSRVETASLERRDADLALRFTIPKNANLVRKRAAIIRYQVFGTSRMLRSPSPPWVGFESGLMDIPEARWLASHAPAKRVVFRATSLDAQLEACAAGVGLALLPTNAPALHPSLVAQSDTVELTRPLWLVAHRDVYAAPRVRAVFRWALEACTQSNEGRTPPHSSSPSGSSSRRQAASSRRGNAATDSPSSSQ